MFVIVRRAPAASAGALEFDALGAGTVASIVDPSAAMMSAFAETVWKLPGLCRRSQVNAQSRRVLER
jgi:hypothetical protein